MCKEEEMVIRCSESERPRKLPQPNFSTPFVTPSLQWSNQRSLRCQKLNALADPIPSPDPTKFASSSDPSNDATPPPTKASLQTPSRPSSNGPWNLRTRTPNCKAPVETDDPEAKRVEFHMSLTKEEINNDFIKMTGSRPPRRVKRRLNTTVQQQPNGVFPGTCLPKTITPDMYKVFDPR